MALHLFTPVAALPGLGEKAVKDLKALKITSLGDLIWHVPFRYDDYSKRKAIGDLKPGDRVTFEATVSSIEARPSRKNRHLVLIEVVLEDGTGEINVAWFNQQYLLDTLKPGTKWSFAGEVERRVGLSLDNPIYEPIGMNVHTGRIVPVYPLTGSLTMRRLRTAMKRAQAVVPEIGEWLPAEILKEVSLVGIHEALASLHFPEDMDHLQAAVNRLKFDELFLYQLMFAEIRGDREQKLAQSIPIEEEGLKTFVKNLPFPLTNAQRRAGWDIVKDMAKEEPMNRLLEGDVGSGKTAVAGLVIDHVARAGYTAVYLAPTEILALQQHASLQKWIKKPVALMTSGQNRLGEEKVRRNDLLKAIKEGKVPVIAGTHALFEEGIEIPDLALVVIDEQHRFGVEQRHSLLNRHPAPHLLSMTATPIPRSLMLTLYGDLDLSILDELPAGRKRIATKVVNDSERVGMWGHVREEIGHGRQVYVVCPLIDPSDALGAKSVAEMEILLKKRDLIGVRIGVLHGKMKSAEKEDMLRQFQERHIDVLLSTTVVEVGVNVQNATIMVIVGAERFGLSQLHQLRGRVGRSDLQSYCYVLPDDASSMAFSRLQVFAQTIDGFALAEKDLQMRGGGNMFGTAQSGFPEFKFATLGDVPLMNQARQIAKRIRGEDPGFVKNPKVGEKVRERLERVHLE